MKRILSSLSVRDLTEAALGLHAMQILVADAVRALARAWGAAVYVHRGTPVVRVEENYDRLRYPADGAARGERYTRWLDAGRRRLLRTQTSAAIPGAMEVVAAVGWEDVLVAVPGLTWRRDAIDRLHVGEPHQLDLWRVRREATAREDLLEMIGVVVGAVLPGRAWTVSEASHPYTVGGLQLEVEGVEIGECGLAHPEVVPEGRHGLAMGLGLDRLLMLRKGIDDIRLLRSEDPRVAAQMLDLEPYRPVSRMPAVARDLSIACGAEVDAETIGDRVRGALGARAECVEEVAVLSETRDLPAAARARIGMREDQKNLLVRVVLRHPSRTLTSEEANRLRDDIYASLHEGTAAQWTTR